MESSCESINVDTASMASMGVFMHLVQSADCFRCGEGDWICYDVAGVNQFCCWALMVHTDLVQYGTVRIGLEAKM